MTNLRIYVGTYYKYNEGSLYGKWLDLANYSSIEEVYGVMRELHKDEHDPEFMFQDWECSKVFEHLGLIGESYLSPKIYEVMQAIKDSCYDEEVIEAFIECFSLGSLDIEEVLEKMEEAYVGEFSNDVDFVQELLEGTGCIPESLPAYVHIDWESTARDIMMDYADSNNHYFRCW